MKKLLLALSCSLAVISVAAIDLSGVVDVLGSIIDTGNQQDKVMAAAASIAKARGMSRVDACTNAQAELLTYIQKLANTTNSALKVFGLPSHSRLDEIRTNPKAALVNLLDEWNKKLSIGLSTEDINKLDVGAIATVAYLLSTKLPSGKLTGFSYNGESFSSYKDLYDYYTKNPAERAAILSALGPTKDMSTLNKFKANARKLRFNLYRGTKVFIGCSKLSQLTDLMNKNEGAVDSVDF